MASTSLNVNEWSQEQFGRCELGDRRRTARLVRYAAQAAADPSSSTPGKRSAGASARRYIV